MIKDINKILKDNSYETTDDYNEEVCVIDVTSKDQRKELAEKIVKKLSIHIVSQQRELLYFFAKDWNENQTTAKTTINSDDIKNCIEKYNCG